MGREELGRGQGCVVMLLPDAHLSHSALGQVCLPPLPSESKGVFSQGSLLRALRERGLSCLNDGGRQGKMATGKREADELCMAGGDGKHPWMALMS